MKGWTSLAALVAVAALPLQAGQQWNWQMIAPSAAGFDAAKLHAVQQELAHRGTRALLIIRHGKIVLEWYAQGNGPEKRQGTASLAKALIGGMSLLVAMNDGRIRPDDLASKYIPLWKNDPLKSRITIRELATHTSGIEDAEQGGLPHSKLTGWKGAFWRRDLNPFSIAVRQAPVLFQPGTGFAYSNPGMAALSYAVTASLSLSASGAREFMKYRGVGPSGLPRPFQGAPGFSTLQGTALPDIKALLENRIMRPLGIRDSEWYIGYGRAYKTDGLNLYANWGGAAFTPRAAAKIGMLMLDRGKWGHRQLVARKWVDRALAYAHTPLPNGPKDRDAPASALGWWINTNGGWKGVPKDAFGGAGAGHQLLAVIPSLDLIVVRNGQILDPGQPGAAFWPPIVNYVLRPIVEAITEKAPYPHSTAIRAIHFADAKSIVRKAIGSDNWPITWGDDNRQYTAYGDGEGFDPKTGKKLSQGFARIEGSPYHFRGINIRSETGERIGDGSKGLKASGMLMVNGVLYLWVRNAHNAQLAWSKNHGKTWEWGFRFKTSFGSPSFLNFGRNYQGARDKYVYTYSQDGPSAYRSDDSLLLARVRKDKIRDRSAWQFFESLDQQGHPVWTSDIDQRGEVFRYPRHCGRVDAVYDRFLKRYLLALAYNQQGGWGIYDAPEPWGPWSAAFHTQHWDLGDTYGYRLPSKWMDRDGRGMILIFSGLAPYDAFCVRRMSIASKD